MSIEYMGVGFLMTIQEAIAPFAKEIPGKEHKEDRFDSKTGKLTHQATVVDSKPMVEVKYKRQKVTVEVDLDGVPQGEWEELEGLLSKLGQDNGFQIHIAGCSDSGEHYGAECRFVMFVPNAAPKMSEEVWSEHERSLPWKEVAALGKALDSVKKKMVKLGYEPGDPVILISG